MYGGSLGGGTFAVTAFVDSSFLTALWIGWALAVGLKGVAHIFFLGRPDRFWRAMMRPNSSWISRGVWIFTLLGLFGLLYLVPATWLNISWMQPGSIYSNIMLVIAVFFAISEMTYPAFQMQRAAFALWKNNLLVILFPALGVMGGAALTGFIMHLGVHGPEGMLSSVDQVAAYAGIVLALTWALFFWTAYRDPLQYEAVRRLAFSKRFAGQFYFWFLGVALGFPVVILLLGHFITAFEMPVVLIMAAEAVWLLKSSLALLRPACQ